MTWDIKKIKQQNFSPEEEAKEEAALSGEEVTPMNTVAMLDFYDSYWDDGASIPFDMEKQYHAMGMWTPKDLRIIRKLMTRGIVPE